MFSKQTPSRTSPRKRSYRKPERPAWYAYRDRETLTLEQIKEERTLMCLGLPLPLLPIKETVESVNGLQIITISRPT